MLEEKIRIDLKQAMLDRDESKKSALRIVIGEIPRLNKKVGENPTDQEIESILRKLIKSEKLTLKTMGKLIQNNKYIEILDSYLPKLMTGEEIVSWISENVTLADFDPKIKAMGTIMKGLKGKVDGNLVKQILIAI